MKLPHGPPVGRWLRNLNGAWLRRDAAPVVRKRILMRAGSADLRRAAATAAFTPCSRRLPVFDVIGDIHGEADKLAALLCKLGYSEVDQVWRHAQRTAIFVGDLIDRGPKQLETVHIVRGMVDAGCAQCVLGNHEFNAIAWVTPDPERPGHFLRDHHKAGNREQHQAKSLKALPDSGRSRNGSRRCRCGWM